MKYSDLKGTPLKKVINGNMPEWKYTDCFVAQIQAGKGLTIMGYCPVRKKEVRIFCIRTHDPEYAKQMRHTIKAIKAGTWDGRKWAKTFNRQATGVEGEPICAFE